MSKKKQTPQKATTDKIPAAKGTVPKARILENQDGTSTQQKKVKKKKANPTVDIVETIKIPRGTTGLKTIRTMSRTHPNRDPDKAVTAIKPIDPDASEA